MTKISELLKKEPTRPVQVKVRESLYVEARKVMEKKDITWNELFEASLIVFLRENGVKID